MAFDNAPVVRSVEWELDLVVGSRVTGAVAAALACWIVAGTASAADPEQGIRSRNMDAPRSKAASAPRSEGDQALAGAWPLYRTERGQQAFNEAMATLAATEGVVPPKSAFKACPDLACKLALPAMTSDGWLPPGRLWVSPAAYILIVKSPRAREGREPRRRSFASMRYFVLHEFHNSSRNTDTFDTISSHKGAVFVPFYMSKTQTDAKGRQFVMIVQVSPYDVVSIHAGNRGSAGPGVEVAKNFNDALEPLQASAGIVLASAMKAAAPHLDVVNHRGSEGLPMLEAWRRQQSAMRDAGAKVSLPFVAARAERMSAAAHDLGDLIRRSGVSAPVAVAARGIVPRQVPAFSLVPFESEAKAAVADAPMGLTLQKPPPPARPPPVHRPRLVEPVKPAAEAACASGFAYSAFGPCNVQSLGQ